MQVKIRGFRIELQDIEQTLLRHPAVSQCVANVRTIGGTPQLVAFVVSSQDDLQSKELHDRLFLPQTRAWTWTQQVVDEYVHERLSIRQHPDREQTCARHHS